MSLMISRNVNNKTQSSFLTDDSKVKTDVGYEKMLFLHLARMSGVSMMPGFETYYLQGVMFLDSIMEGDKDQTYRKDIAEINAWRDYQVQRLSMQAEENPQIMQRLEREFATLWLKKIMTLMHRKGYTPRVQTVDEIT